MGSYYKITRPDGWDFYSGHTINYRDALGGVVVPPKSNGKPKLCSNRVIHASLDPNQCFVGGKIPCAVFRVEGEPVVGDKTKCGFIALRVVEELNPTAVFAWRYAEACHPLHPLELPPGPITDAVLEQLADWASVRDNVWARVRARVRNRVGKSLWDDVGAPLGVSVRNDLWDRVGARLRDSMWDVEFDNLSKSVWAYVGWIFAPAVEEWRVTYPYQASVDLWQQGMVPSFDGARWRLHGGRNAAILYTSPQAK